MAIYKEFAQNDIKFSKSNLNQLIDILQEDISGSATRKKTQIWVSNSIGPGVTSSLWQTVYDQDFSLQTANPIFDMTIGLYSGSSVVVNSGYSIDSAGKYLFPSNTLMMREKMDIYKQFAQSLLGDASSQFQTVSGSTTNGISEALFICFKRLFSRDQIKRETFAIKMYTSATNPENIGAYKENLYYPALSASIYTDISSSVNKELSFAGQVSTIVDSANVNNPVGLLYIDKGILVLDIARVIHPGTGQLALTGTINAVGSTGATAFTGSVNQFLASASIDNIVDHFATTRFSGSAQTAMTFQNVTNIFSSLYFCNIGPDEFCYSSNETFTDSNNRIVVIDPGQEESQQSFVFITTLGLFDSQNRLLAVAKTSRPILHDNERMTSIKIRLDFFTRKSRVYTTKPKSF